MTTFLLIRHAAHDLLGKVLAGRAPDVHLSARGKMDAERLGERLAGRGISAIYTGPLERAQETAWPLAGRLTLDTKINSAFDEIDFGEWMAVAFSDLEASPAWHQWNTARESATPPGGEGMKAVQQRVTEELARLAAIHANESVAVVSHGDVIKAAIMHYLAIPLNHYFRFEISPASVSELLIDGAGAQVVSMNTLCHL